MKIAYAHNDKARLNPLEVSDDTVVNTVNGIHYLLSPQEEVEIEERGRTWAQRRLQADKEQLKLKAKEALKESDWTQLLDAPLSPHQQAAWTSYRNELRTIINSDNPQNIQWPTEPR